MDEKITDLFVELVRGLQQENRTLRAHNVELAERAAQERVHSVMARDQALKEGEERSLHRHGVRVREVEDGGGPESGGIFTGPGETEAEQMLAGVEPLPDGSMPADHQPDPWTTMFQTLFRGSGNSDADEEASA